MKQLLNISRKANGFEVNLTFLESSLDTYSFVSQETGTIEKVISTNCSNVQVVKFVGVQVIEIYNSNSPSNFDVERNETYRVNITRTVANTQSNVELIAINYPSSQVNISVPNVVSNAGKYAFFNNRESKTISIVDLDTLGIVTTLNYPNSYRCDTIGYNEDNDSVYCWGYRGATNNYCVAKIDCSNAPTFQITDLLGNLNQTTDFVLSSTGFAGASVYNPNSKVWIVSRSDLRNFFFKEDPDTHIISSSSFNVTGTLGHASFKKEVNRALLYTYRHFYENESNGYVDRLLSTTCSFNWDEPNTVLQNSYQTGGGARIADLNGNSITGAFGPSGFNAGQTPPIKDYDENFVMTLIPGAGITTTGLTKRGLNIDFHDRSNLNNKAYWYINSDVEQSVNCDCLIGCIVDPVRKLIIAREASSAYLGNPGPLTGLVNAFFIDYSRVDSSTWAGGLLGTGTGANEISLTKLDLSVGGTVDAISLGGVNAYESMGQICLNQSQRN